MFGWIAFGAVGLAILLTWSLISEWLIHNGGRALCLWKRLEQGYLPAPDEVVATCKSGMDRLATAHGQAWEHAHRPLGLAEMLAHVDRCLAQIEALLRDWRLRLLLPGSDDFCAVTVEPTFLAARRPRSRRLRLLALIERFWRRAAENVLHVNWRLRWVEREQAWMMHHASARNAAWHIHVTTLGWAVRVARWAVWGARFVPPERLPRRLASVYDEVGLLLRECCHTYRALWHGFVGWRGALNPTSSA